MVEPFAGDEAPVRAAPGEAMDKDEVRLQADQHVREDDVVVGPLQIRPLEAGEVGRAALAGGRHSATGPADLHRAAEKRALLEVVRGRPEVAELVQGGVDCGAVVALGIILNDQLPIGGNVVFDLVGGLQAADFPGPESLLQRGEVGFEMVWIIGEIDEDRPQQRFAGGGLERIVIFLKALGFIHIGSADKPPVERVGPGVVGAGDVLAEFSLVARAEPGSAMPAEVEKGADLSSRIPDDDDSLVSLGVDEEFSGFPDGRFSSNVDPLPGEDPFALAVIDLLVGKISSGEGCGVVAWGFCHHERCLVNRCSRRLRWCALM